ncbi:polysaccharide biosynthesis/export family protein [Aliiroseovarius lamellibrachiae]|uniref:polysaccharide biosynthesis/export family protein n=1 Tax=Aliiroseovarius lamellibrachiae TaxID=1924933 RepID=UPI001BE02643|nr:polysaccharide biosynthesis/export family protein [Aliiroseovarius lamellibrachiae]MBT2131499.1 polysaccharide export protein [Aliiroseovarius lamellibrachiae]
MLRLVLSVGAIALLSACNLPRGAALQSEIVAAANAPTPQIALYQVDRSTLPEYQAWPMTGGVKNHGWLRHKHQGPENAISAGDEISIVIWDSEEASLLSGRGNRATQMKSLKVSTGGTVFLPFAGAVQVAGLSETSARNRIQRKMSEVVPSAQVQLAVTKGAKGSVSVVSGVLRPGSYPVDSSHFTVLNAVATAGGANARIENPQLRLIRAGKVYTKSMSALLENPDLDTVLRGGDKLSVETDKRYFRSLGAAAKEAIIPFSKDEISALDAMSMIGGLSEKRANLKGIMVLRDYDAAHVRQDGSGPSNERSVFVFDLASADGLFSAGEFAIHPKDTVLVTETSIASATTALTVLSRLAGIASDVNSLN